MNEITLRPYQEECEKVIEEKGNGRYLIALATGLGKTFIFTHINRKGRVLILSHREELVYQPKKYYEKECSFGVEKADIYSDGEEVVSASVQTLAKDTRLRRFSPDAFHTIIVDEAHHAAAPTYKKILSYFSGAKRVLGFTATPSRGDGVRLDDVFSEIIFAHDLRWGINHEYLSRIRCNNVSADYDLSEVSKSMGDFNAKELEKALNNSTALSVAAKAYMEFCHNQNRHTLIYCLTVDMAKTLRSSIEKLLPQKEKGTIAVLTGTTPADERKQILDDFQSGKIACIVNCMVLTEGTDLPICDTIINLRPTCNDSLYQQIVGRGTRLYPGKDYCLVLDVIPEEKAKNHTLCTAPTLFGIDPDFVDEETAKRFTQDNDLLSVCDEVAQIAADYSAKIKLKLRQIDLFMEESNALLDELLVKRSSDFDTLTRKYKSIGERREDESDEYDFGNMDVSVQADNNHHYVISPNWKEKIYLSKPDVLGNTVITFDGTLFFNRDMTLTQEMSMSSAIELAKEYCAIQEWYYSFSWNKDIQSEWSKKPATEKQIWKIKSSYGGLADNLNRYEASKIIDLLEMRKDYSKIQRMYEKASGKKTLKKTKNAMEDVKLFERREQRKQDVTQNDWQLFESLLHEKYNKKMDEVEVRIDYREYKCKYSKYDQIPNSYNKEDHTVAVLMPKEDAKKREKEKKKYLENVIEVKVKYKDYKNMYSEYLQKPNSYNPEEKSVILLIPKEKSLESQSDVLTKPETSEKDAGDEELEL